MPELKPNIWPGPLQNSFKETKMVSSDAYLHKIFLNLTSTWVFTGFSFKTSTWTRTIWGVFSCQTSQIWFKSTLSQSDHTLIICNDAPAPLSHVWTNHWRSLNVAIIICTLVCSILQFFSCASEVQQTRERTGEEARNTATTGIA